MEIAAKEYEEEANDEGVERKRLQKHELQTNRHRVTVLSPTCHDLTFLYMETKVDRLLLYIDGG